MNILCNGDSHVKGFRDFIGHNQDSSDLFNVQNISHVDFFGVSGGTVTNPRHLKTVLVAVHQYQPTIASPHIFTKIKMAIVFFSRKLKIKFVHKFSDCLHILSCLPYTSHMTNDLSLSL